jgi:hypothetical protein
MQHKQSVTKAMFDKVLAKVGSDPGITRTDYVNTTDRSI